MALADAFTERLEIAWMAASPAEARIEARLADWPAGGGWQLQGAVSGPACGYSRTLAARVPLVQRGDGGELVAEALLPDPCFWSPRLPFVYEAEVDLLQGEALVGRARRTLGIRLLSAQGRGLRLEGRGWVLRGAQAPRLEGAELEAFLAQCHSAALALVAKGADEALCRQASRLGVLLVAESSGSEEQVASELRRWARWPAVGVAVLPRITLHPATLRQAAGHMLLAQQFAAGEPLEPAPWAQLAVCEVESHLAQAKGGQPPAARLRPCGLPVIARRPAAARQDPAAARALCDVLQRELAGQGDWAGYIV